MYQTVKLCIFQMSEMLLAWIILLHVVSVRAAIIDKPINNLYDESDIAEFEFLDEELEHSTSPVDPNGNWSHADADEWSNIYPTCGGRFQSPIVLDPEAIIAWDAPPFVFTNYDVEMTAIVENTGRWLQLRVSGDDVPILSGGGLIGTYVFSQMHFHLGNFETPGSEHVKDWRRFPGEIHYVHYNSKYGGFAEALQHPDGVAVLGVFIEEGSIDNQFYEPIIESLESVKKPDLEVTLQNLVTLEDFLPNDVRKFYRYFGSLTTPPCLEVVTWTLFDDPVSLSSIQLLDNNNFPLVDNVRPTQALNNRVIYAQGF